MLDFGTHRLYVQFLAQQPMFPGVETGGVVQYPYGVALVETREAQTKAREELADHRPHPLDRPLYHFPLCDLSDYSVPLTTSQCSD